jgi:hypothetical protein
MGRKPATKSEFAARVFEADQAAGAEPVSSPDTPPIVPAACFDLEEMFTAEWGSRIDTATPCQRAICRMLQGKPVNDLAEQDGRVLEMFGGALPTAGTVPNVVLIISGIRTAKSTVIADMAIAITQTIELPEWIRPSDEVRIPIVSTDVDTAKATFTHVVETILSSPRLAALLAVDDNGKPIEPKADSVLLRHPSGRNIEIKVVALSRAGATLTARWFAGAIFDEAPRMGGEVDYVRSFDEAFRACRGRVLPGGTIMLGGSPHARVGPIYDLYRRHFGKPDTSFVVAKAKGPWLNPVYWTPERCEELKRQDPIAHQTDVEADFKDPESALGDSASIEAAMRETAAHLAPVKGHHYVATMDPATRVNTWTFTITECYGHRGLAPAFRVALHKQWVPEPGRTLSPDSVLAEVAADCKRYGLTECYSDIASADFAIDLAAQHGLSLLIETGVDLLDLGRELMTMIRRSLLELPNDDKVREDLQSVRTRTSTNGNVNILLPRSSGGRHCDYFPALCLFVKNQPEPPDDPLLELDLDALDLQRELAEFDERNDPDANEAARRLCGH